MSIRFLNSLFLTLLLVLGGCNSETGRVSEQSSPSATDGRFLTEWNNALTDVMVTDIVSPPVASRMYAYPNIAAYEVIAHLDPEFRSLAGQIRDLQAIPGPEGVVDPELASIVAFSRVAQKLVFDGSPLAQREAVTLEESRRMLPRNLFEASVAYGEAVAASIQAYAATDNYAETRSMPRYQVELANPSLWVPTPPDYHDGLEPNWNHVRPFVLTSADEFVPDPPTPFDESESSPFYQEMMEVYAAVNEADEERVEIAQFWDCNPFASTHDGHTVSFEKKITPGGHWIGIAGIAATVENLDAARTAEAYAITAIALFDAFISCWDEKYRSALTRPETVINRYVDPEWQPILQTPPFPEYTSGHSVASGSASVILTELFGEAFAFDDSTEVNFGLPVRSFESFRDAADEAAISRLYGGIHYMPAIENGVAQGRAVGQRVANAIQTRVQAS